MVEKEENLKFNNKVLFVIVVILLIILLSTNSISYFSYLNKVLSCPYPAEYGEGVVYNLCVRLSEGETIYHPLDEFPYIHNPYTPLYFIISSFNLKIFGSSPNVCRFVSIFCAFGTILVILFMIFNRTRSLLSSVIFSLFLFSSSYFFEWSPLVRVDMTGVFLSLTGLYIADRSKKGSKLIYLSILFFLAGILTKQSLFAAPLSVIVFLFIYERRIFLRYFCLFFSGLGFLYFALQYFSEGNFFDHAIICNVIEYDLSVALISLGITLTAYYGLTTLSIFSCLKSFKEKKLGPLNFYLLFTLLAGFSIGKAGGANNHLMELIIALTLNAAISYKHISDGFSGKNSSASGLKLISLILVFTQLLSLYFIDTSITNKMSSESLGSKKKPVAWTPYNQSEVSEYNRLDAKQYKEISKFIKSVDDPILCENVGLLTINNREVIYQPFQFKHLAKMDRFDEGIIIRMIEEGEFKLIILTKGSIKEGVSWLYGDKILDSIWKNYAPIKVIGEYEIYAFISNLL